MERLDRVRERDYSLVDTLNEHYTNFQREHGRRLRQLAQVLTEELEAEADAGRKALTRQVLGAVAVVGGVGGQ